MVWVVSAAVCSLSKIGGEQMRGEWDFRQGERKQQTIKGQGREQAYRSVDKVIAMQLAVFTAAVVRLAKGHAGEAACDGT